MILWRVLEFRDDPGLHVEAGVRDVGALRVAADGEFEVVGLCVDAADGVGGVEADLNVVDGEGFLSEGDVGVRGRVGTGGARKRQGRSDVERGLPDSRPRPVDPVDPRIPLRHKVSAWTRASR